MYGLGAFDPANTALRQSSAYLGLVDRRQRWDVAARLVRFYEGNQEPYLQQYIAALFKDKKLQARYGELASWENVTRWIVDRVTALGDDALQVTWANAADMKLWDEVAYQRADFDLFVGAMARYLELTKTVVALVSWDDDEECVRLDFLTPNVLEVAYSRHGLHPTCPDMWRLLKNEGGAHGEEWQVWDFSTDAPKVYEEVAGKRGGSTAEPWEVVDPLTGRPLCPFVALRTNYAQREFFIDDGQMELLDGQEAINRTWTQLFANLHGGAFKVAVLQGPGWGVGGGGSRDVRLTLDQSEAIVCPNDPANTTQPTIRWDSPYDPAITTSLLEVIAKKRESMAQSFHFDASAIVATPKAESGIALWVRNQSLRKKLQWTRTLAAKPIAQIVWAMACVWNHYSRDPRKFTVTEKPTVKIPDPTFQMDPATELLIDKEKIAMGIMSRRDLVKKWRPELGEREVEALLEEIPPIPTPPSMKAPAAPEMNEMNGGAVQREE